MLLEIFIEMEKVQSVKPLFDVHLCYMHDLLINKFTGMLYSCFWRITERKKVTLQFRHAYLVNRELVCKFNCQLFFIWIKPFKKA